MDDFYLPNDDVYYIIVYYKNKITITQAQWFDVYDYKIASRKYFDLNKEKECVKYAKELAKKNELEFEYEFDDNHFLD